MNEDDYGTGYADGKAKGLFECAIAVGHMSLRLSVGAPHAWAYGMPCSR